MATETEPNGREGLPLLRCLFEADEVGVPLAVTELFRYQKFSIVVDFLVKELACKQAIEVEPYIFQLSLLCTESTAIADLLSQKCSESLHFAVKTLLNLQTNAEDENERENLEISSKYRDVFRRCQQSACVGIKQDYRASSLTCRQSLDEEELKRTSSRRQSLGEKGNRTLALRSYRSALGMSQLAFKENFRSSLPRVFRPMEPLAGEPNFRPPNPGLLAERQRLRYIQDSLFLLQLLVDASDYLRMLPRSERTDALRRRLLSVNQILLQRLTNGRESKKAISYLDCLRAVHLPTTKGNEAPMRILRVVPEDFKLLSSRERAPFMVSIEVLSSNLKSCHDENIFREDEQVDAHPELLRHPEIKATMKLDMVTLPDEDEEEHDTKADSAPDNREEPDGVENDESNAEEGDRRTDSEDEDGERIHGEQLKTQIFGPSWSSLQKRIAENSPFCQLPGYGVTQVIVKAGDDLRQEVFALDFIRTFREIYEQEGLGRLGIVDYAILCVCVDAGLVEVVPNCVSLHVLKTRAPGFTSLVDCFERMYGNVDSDSFRAAQDNFLVSLAGYSVVCYFGDITDRHNGNILMTSDGGLIHIDFGYMLAKSPGAIKFEQAPFKFTTEYLEVLGGRDSAAFNKFCDLFTAGFMAARKHKGRIISSLEIMDGTSLKCMGEEDDNVVETLTAKFFLELSDEECIPAVRKLIDNSCENWTTVQYDHYQYMQNGYL